MATSLLRERLTTSVWRAVHWLSYAAYPVVVVHSISASKDLRSGWLLILTMTTIFTVTTAMAYRILDTRAAVPRPGLVHEKLVRAEQTRRLR